MSKRRNPWDRLSKEPDRAWEAFQVYLDLGPARGQRATQRAMGSKVVTSINQWAKRYDWETRAGAFDMVGIEDGMRVRTRLRAVVMNRIHQELDKAASYLIDLAEGKIEGATPNTRMHAAVKLLELGGAIPPKRVEVTKYDGDKIKHAQSELDTLNDDQARELLSQIKVVH